MTLLLVLHLLTGAVCVLGGERLGRAAYALAAVPLLATGGWLLGQLGGVLDGGAVVERRSWVPELGLGLDLRLDAAGALLLALVVGIGLCVVAYAAAYHRTGGLGLARQAGLLTIFAGAMVGIAVADDLLVLVSCWEVTSITSYLLIGNRHTSAKARAAALHALLVTGSGGLCLLAGVVLLGQRAGTYRLSEVLADPPAGATAALVLVLLGVATKSAQYPFHGWLPGAMVAPTPISAYLHSATMVKAGVFLLARLAPAFAAEPLWRPAVLALGATTMVAGALRALRQHDLKLLLAFGTLSQLGFLVVLVGLGIPEATAAGCVLLLAHGLFKAALFFVVGLLDQVAGTRDLRELPRLGRAWRPTALVVVVATASMAGLPLAFGFIAKEAAYAALAEADLARAGWLLSLVVAGSVGTVAYSWRFAWGVLGAPARRGAPHQRTGPDAAFVAPALVLTAATVVLGLRPALVDRLVGAAATALDPGAHPEHLALWHGVNLPLVLSGVTVALGAVLAAANGATTRWFDARRSLPTSGDAYLAGLRRLNRGADVVTGVVQSGSLPVYTGVILATAALVPTAVLLAHDVAGPRPPLLDTPAHVALAAVLVGSALAAATIRRRLSAALFLGVTGYGMAGLFVVQGAPDLALTQVTVETLSTVLFVLVLRRLPVNFERRASARTRALRIAVAAAVAAGVFAFALQVGTVRDRTPVADEIAARAEPEGHGRNVVNVILVDVRAFDTLGEITVLATAAIGMVALARAGRRPRRATPASAPPVPSEAGS